MKHSTKLAYSTCYFHIVNMWFSMWIRSIKIPERFIAFIISNFLRHQSINPFSSIEQSFKYVVFLTYYNSISHSIHWNLFHLRLIIDSKMCRAHCVVYFCIFSISDNTGRNGTTKYKTNFAYRNGPYTILNTTL